MKAKPPLPAPDVHARLAADLYKCRDAARTLLGDRYEQGIASWTTAIRRLVEQEKLTDLGAAIKLAQAGDGYEQVVAMAAFLEMIQPSPA